MEQRDFKYGGLTFSFDEICFVRRLALGAEVVADYWEYYHGERTALLLLKSRGLCTEHSNGAVGKNEVLTYRPTPLMLELAEKQRASTYTFDALAEKMGLDISPATVKKLSRKRRLFRRDELRYPTLFEVSHQIAIEIQGPGMTINAPVELSDELQFSSRGLTDWYVRTFCTTNALKL
jgi:hypothetical protein